MSEPSHIERERDEAMNALRNIHRWCILHDRGQLNDRELKSWTAHECEKVFLGEENARKI